MFDTADTITAEEMKKALQDREIYLAQQKKNAEEYRASKQSGGNGASPAAQAANAVKAGGFNW